MTATVDDTSPFGTYEPNSVQRRLYRFMAGLYGYGWIGKRIFGRLRWLDRLVASGEIADVGANCGFYAVRVAAAGGRVVAVEPHPQMFRRLQFNVALNPDCPVRLLQCAVGDRHGDIGIAEDPRNLGRTRIDGAGAIRAEMRPLLDILRGEKIERLDALKVDVEGFEDRVLAPFLEDAPDGLLPATIVAEHTWSDHWAEDWRRAADNRGYREWARTPTGNVILIRDP